MGENGVLNSLQAPTTFFLSQTSTGIMLKHKVHKKQWVYSGFLLLDPFLFPATAYPTVPAKAYTWKIFISLEKFCFSLICC